MKSLAFLTTILRPAALALLLPAGMLAAQNPDSPAISKLLHEVGHHASLADDDAHTLGSYTLGNLNWKTHGLVLINIKEHVNNLIRDSNQLTTMRDEGSPWQQEAIDRISNLLPEVAANLTATINFLNDHKNQTKMRPYQDLAKNNETLLHKANEIIKDFVGYSQAKEKADALQKQTQLPAAS